MTAIFLIVQKIRLAQTISQFKRQLPQLNLVVGIRIVPEPQFEELANAAIHIVETLGVTVVWLDNPTAAVMDPTNDRDFNDRDFNVRRAEKTWSVASEEELGVVHLVVAGSISSDTSGNGKFNFRYFRPYRELLCFQELPAKPNLLEKFENLVVRQLYNIHLRMTITNRSVPSS